MTPRIEELLRTESSPCYDAGAVTPHDTNDLAYLSRALYVGGDGNINLITANGSTVLFPSLVAGTILPVRCSRVMSTSTTATNIVALY
jgi:hypothetical protein